MSYILTQEQARVGVAAGFFTDKDVEKAKTNPEGFIAEGWYLKKEGDAPRD